MFDWVLNTPKKLTGKTGFVQKFRRADIQFTRIAITSQSVIFKQLKNVRTEVFLRKRYSENLHTSNFRMTGNFGKITYF